MWAMAALMQVRDSVQRARRVRSTPLSVVHISIVYLTARRSRFSPQSTPLSRTQLTQRSTIISLSTAHSIHFTGFMDTHRIQSALCPIHVQTSVTLTNYTVLLSSAPTRNSYQSCLFSQAASAGRGGTGGGEGGGGTGGDGAESGGAGTGGAGGSGAGSSGARCRRRWRRWQGSAATAAARAAVHWWEY